MRADRHDFWFPLALLGFLLLGVAATRPVADFGWFAYSSPSGAPYAFMERRDWLALDGIEPDGFHITEPAGAGWYGLGAVLGLFVVTVAWYAARARRLGGPVPAARLATVTLAGGAELALGYLVLEELRGPLDDEFAAALALPLLLLAALLGVLAYAARGLWRRIAALAGVLVLGVAACAVLLPSSHDATVVLLVAAGLGVLAWLHRSPLLGGVTALFLLTSGGDGGADAARWVVPAAVVLAGAIAALVLRARARNPQWTMER